MIYFDNAATSLLKPDCIADAVYQAIKTLGNCNRGIHEGTLSASRLLLNARETVSNFFHGDGAETVVFTSNITESLNIVIQGLFHEGDHVITTVLDHNSVLRPLYFMESKGVSLSIVGCNELGVVDYDALNSMIGPNTKAIVCTHASNLTGNLIDIEHVSSLCKQHNLLFILDTAQTAGILPIYQKENNIDILCFTGHKGLLGPQGTGGFLVKKGLFINPLKYGGGGNSSYLKGQPIQMPEALEAGTLNIHGLAGLMAGIEYINNYGLTRIHEEELSLMWRFYNCIVSLPNVTVYGDFDVKERAPIVSLNIGTLDSGVVADYLSYDYNIAIRSGAHCAPLMHEALHTTTQGAVRFSFSHLNTASEVDSAINAIKELSNSYGNTKE